MAEEVETTSQPASDARGIVAKHFADYAPEETPQAPVAEAAPAEAETFDPATIKIPNKQFTTNVPKALEKFKDKTLVDLATSYENAERTMHEKSQEAAQTRRENEELKARLAAAEQFTRMTQAPQVQEPTDPYARAGINPDEAIITDTRRVLNTTLDEARRIAREETERAKREVRAESAAERQQQNQANELITAFELARQEVGKMTGKEFTVPEWQNELEDLARLVQAREPGRITDHKAYVETYVRLRGVPKVTVPAEGNPPIAAKPGVVRSERPASTLTREEQQLNRQIRKSLGLDA